MFVFSLQNTMVTVFLQREGERIYICIYIDRGCIYVERESNCTEPWVSRVPKTDAARHADEMEREREREEIETEKERERERERRERERKRIKIMMKG